MRITLQATDTKNVQQNSLKSDVQTAMQLRGYLRLRPVRVDADRETVTLSGKLKSFYLKQLAQEISKKVPGVCRVINHIEVTKDTVQQFEANANDSNVHSLIPHPLSVGVSWQNSSP